MHALAQARPTMLYILLVLHQLFLFLYIRIIGASLSEPHIDEFAVNLYMYRTSCRKSLPGRILRVLESCVISNLSLLSYFLHARALIS